METATLKFNSNLTGANELGTYLNLMYGDAWRQRTLWIYRFHLTGITVSIILKQHGPSPYKGKFSSGEMASLHWNGQMSPGRYHTETMSIKISINIVPVKKILLLPLPYLHLKLEGMKCMFYYIKINVCNFINWKYSLTYLHTMQPASPWNTSISLLTLNDLSQRTFAPCLIFCMHIGPKIIYCVPHM